MHNRRPFVREMMEVKPSISRRSTVRKKSGDKEISLPPIHLREPNQLIDGFRMQSESVNVYGTLTQRLGVAGN